MRSWKISILALGLLAACDGNPFANGGGGGGGPVVPPTPNEVPADVARDLAGVSYDGTNLLIDIAGISSSEAFATFIAAPFLDIPDAGGGPGYLAYVYQESPNTRSYLAYVAENALGSLIAVSTADGGQFNEHNAGGSYYRLTSYSRPASGVFTYAGTYAGIFVPGNYTTSSSPNPDSTRPVEPWVVLGSMQMNGSFSDNLVEGAVAERLLYDQSNALVTGFTVDGTTFDFTTDPLADLVLRETAIDANGEFLGSVEFFGSPGTAVGQYGGIFGGLNASDLAGVLWLNPLDGQSGIFEYGTFNLPRCDLAGTSPLCLP